MQLPDPVKGLTFRKGQIEANVHEVCNGRVYYGVYRDGVEWPESLLQCSVPHWEWLAEKALADGAVMFSLLTPNAEVSR